MLKRLADPSYALIVSQIEDLITYKVTKPFPFRTPVPVKLKHTVLRLPKERLLGCIRGLYDLNTHYGLECCVQWLLWQYEDLKDSPLHDQRTNSSPCEISQFLIDV